MKNDEAFKRWLKETFGKGLKWFQKQAQQKKKKIKTKYTTDKPLVCPVDEGTDCVIRDEKEFKLEPGQTFARQITDVGGEKFYKQNTLGQGFIYADLDSGLNLHEGIAHLEKTKRLTRLSFVYEPGSSTNILPNPSGDENHGSHVAGLTSGRGRIITGLAPEVDHYYQIKVSHQGMGFFDSFNNALKYLLSLPDDEFPDFIGFSNGIVLEPGYEADDIKLTKSLITECSNKGAILTGSAGNLGVPLWMPERYTVARQTFPSTLPEVLAIANVNWSNVVEATSSPGNIAYCSNGANVISFGTKYDEYVYMTGTSMARPSATGFMMAAGTECRVKNRVSKQKYKKGLNEYLAQYCWDLGVEGKDPDYGKGFLAVVPQI